jgi:hypothetical protein
MAHVDEAVAPAKGGHDQDLTVTVVWADDDAPFTVSKTTKVGELITVAVSQFGLSPNDKYDLALPGKPGEPLDHHRPLVSYHLKDGDELLLTATGGGV